MPSRRGIVDNLTVKEYLADDAYYDDNQTVKSYANRIRESFRQVERKWNRSVYSLPKASSRDGIDPFFRWCNQFDFDSQVTLLKSTKFRLFIRWMVKNSRMKKQSSVMQQWKRLRLIYAEASEQKLQKKIDYEIFRVRVLDVIYI